MLWETHTICIQPGDPGLALPPPALGKVPFWFTPATSLLLPAAPPLSLGHFGLFSLRSRWHIFICLALSANVLSLLGILQIFSLSFGKTQCRRWKFRSLILRAESLSLLEAMVSSEDGLLFLSASMPIASCGFQLHGVQPSWLFLGCLRSKRKQRLYFLVTLLCRAVMQRGGVIFWIFSVASRWPRKTLEQQEGSIRVSYVTHILPYSQEK